MSQAAGEPLLYSLYAVLVHGGGSCRAGHYFCYIKASDGLWYHMDDKSVDLCDSDTVLRQQAYLLFYIRCSDLEVGQRASSSPAPSEARSLLSQWAAGSKQVRSVGQQHLPHRTKAAVGRWSGHQMDSGFLLGILAALSFPSYTAAFCTDAARLPLPTSTWIHHICPPWLLCSLQEPLGGH
ncbi:ubiquitin carboxyl-terminal hydrolase 42-like [Columba livia]|uniref:ubiquitin carboxyl-terminal hydrolase 42-like n=1 Tax=Columba livia TaxID=8932 RepID=UPI0031BA8EED